MNLLGIGPLELFFIIVIALIILGPKDVVKTSQTIGRWLRQVITSDAWRTVRSTSKEIRDIPNRLMREASVDELKKGMLTEDEIRKSLAFDELQKGVQDINAGLSDWTTTPTQKIDPRSNPGQSVPTPTPKPVPVKPTVAKPATPKEGLSESDWTTPRQRKVVESPPIEAAEEDKSEPNAESITPPLTTYPPPITESSPPSEKPGQ